MFSLKQKYKMWTVFDQPIRTSFYFFYVRCENFAFNHNKRFLRADPCCRSVIKEFAYASSCAYIELWMHLESLESTQHQSTSTSIQSDTCYEKRQLKKVELSEQGQHLSNILHFKHIKEGSVKKLPMPMRKTQWPSIQDNEINTCMQILRKL